MDGGGAGRDCLGVAPGGELRALPRTQGEPLPGHGPAIDDPQTILSGYLEHRRQRERQVLDALRAGHATVQAIAESIYDGLAPALMPAARENVRAHLEKLKTEGRAAHVNERWML